jgi:RecA/RadA recombinase
MLISNAESEKFEKGVQTSDMGTRTRLFKHLLRTVVNRIARTNMTMLVTHQVYLNQDVTNGHGEFIVNNAVRYSASQIAVFKPLKLKEGAEIKGIRIKAESYKSRFAQPGIKVEIEVPWETGMDPFSGTLDMLLDMGVITQGGAWYSATIGEETRKFQRKQLDEQLFQWLLTHPKIIEEENRFLSADQVEEQVSED